MFVHDVDLLQIIFCISKSSLIPCHVYVVENVFAAEFVMQALSCASEDQTAFKLYMYVKFIAYQNAVGVFLVYLL